jgi:hypothetical protein
MIQTARTGTAISAPTIPRRAPPAKVARNSLHRDEPVLQLVEEFLEAGKRRFKVEESYIV